MADLHWFPFFAKDWLSSPAVQRMTPEQRGGYIQLLANAWMAGEPYLPNDSAALATMSGLGNRWRKVGALILAQFREKGDLLYNERLTEVWKEQQVRHAKAVERGKRGGFKKHRPTTRPGSSPTTPQLVDGEKQARMAMDLRDQKDLSSRGAGAPAPSEARPAPHVESGKRTGMAKIDPALVAKAMGL